MYIICFSWPLEITVSVQIFVDMETQITQYLPAPRKAAKEGRGEPQKIT
jgi:hypothetical protein